MTHALTPATNGGPPRQGTLGRAIRPGDHGRDQPRQGRRALRRALADIDLVGSLLPAVQTPVKTGLMATASGGCGLDRSLDSQLLASMRSMDRFVWAVVRILAKRLNFAGFSLRAIPSKSPDSRPLRGTNQARREARIPESTWNVEEHYILLQ